MVGLCSVGKTFLKKNTVPIHMGSLESALRLPRRLGLHARTLIFLRWMTHIQILTANSFEYKHMQFGMIEPRNGHGSYLSFNKGDINHNLNAFWIGQMRCLQTVREGRNKKITTLIGPNSSLWILTEFQVRPFFGCYLRTWFIIIRTYTCYFLSLTVVIISKASHSEHSCKPHKLNRALWSCSACCLLQGSRVCVKTRDKFISYRPYETTGPISICCQTAGHHK